MGVKLRKKRLDKLDKKRDKRRSEWTIAEENLSVHSAETGGTKKYLSPKELKEREKLERKNKRAMRKYHKADKKRVKLRKKYEAK